MTAADEALTVEPNELTQALWDLVGRMPKQMGDPWVGLAVHQIAEALESGALAAHGYPSKMMEIGAWCVPHDHDYELCKGAMTWACDPVPLFRLVPQEDG